MNVIGSVYRNIQYSLRQNQSVGRHYQNIGLQGGQGVPILLFPEIQRLKDRNAQFPRRGLDVRLPEPAAAPGGAIRLLRPFGLSGWVRTPQISCPSSTSRRREATAKSGVPMKTMRSLLVVITVWAGGKRFSRILLFRCSACLVIAKSCWSVPQFRDAGFTPEAGALRRK